MNTLQELRAKPHLSASALSTMLRCPLQYKFRYIDRLPETTASPDLLFGKAVDLVIEAYFAAYLAKKRRLPAEALIELFNEQWKKAVDEETRPITYKEGASFETLRQTGISIMTVVAEKLDPSTIKGTKHAFSLDIPDVDVPVIGELDGREDKAIVEIKTAARKYSEGQVGDNLQFALYGLYLNDAEAVDATTVRIFVLTKTKSPELQICERKIDHRQDNRTVALIQALWKAIQAGNFYPVPNHLCGYCAYRKNCARWA